MFDKQCNVSKAEKAEMLKRYKQGETVEQIAKEMKRHVVTIHRHLRKLGAIPESISTKLKMEKEQDKEAMKAIRKRNALDLKIGDSVKYSIKGNEDSDSGCKNVRDGKIISITDFVIAIKNENGYVECVNRSAINTETFAHKIRKVK